MMSSRGYCTSWRRSQGSCRRVNSSTNYQQTLNDSPAATSGTVHSFFYVPTYSTYTPFTVKQFYNTRVILTDLAEDGENEVNQHFCCLHSPNVSSDTQTPEPSSETLHDMCAEEQKTDDNRNRPIDDKSVHDSTRPSQTRTISDKITIRQRNKRPIQ